MEGTKLNPVLELEPLLVETLKVASQASSLGEKPEKEEGSSGFLTQIVNTSN